ncbi:MAG: 3'-5' exonuclease [Alcanivorax sp.]
MKVIQTRFLNKCFRKLARSGKKGKDAITKVRAAMSEAGSEGEIKSLQRTNNGESRVQNAEKYDLGNGYRLVVQLVDREKGVRAFLFVGTHDDTENWLENHRDYKWVESRKDRTLEFVKVSSVTESSKKAVEPDLDSPEELLKLPLLRGVEKELLRDIADNDLIEYAMGITSEKWEEDSSGVSSYIEDQYGTDSALLFIDLFSLAHAREFKSLRSRIEIDRGGAAVASDNDAAKAMTDPVNSETFVTWDEAASLPENSSWADWLLFLHPKQKELSIREFRGPARLRGVSGSGKTCVMLHRARFLAKKYKQPIVILTLTESMRRLLDSLVNELCGVESSSISTYTINGFAEKIIFDLHPNGASCFTRLGDAGMKDLSRKVRNYVKSHEDFRGGVFSGEKGSSIEKFIDEEISHIRSRLLPSEYDKYKDGKMFKRVGRGKALMTSDRRAFLDAAKYKDEQLRQLLKLDYEGVVSGAVALLSLDKSCADYGWKSIDRERLKKKVYNYAPYRCVLVDEVQDLSQLEVRMLGLLPVRGGSNISLEKDGLFLVGDGAQKIYNKGFVLKSCGVNVANRSFVLKKNYRNTKEIMRAAYALIENYEYADVDEDNVINPTEPDFPEAVGERPYIVKCKNTQDQVDFSVERVESIIKDYQALVDDDRVYPQVCLIGLNSKIRQSLSDRLSKKCLNAQELRKNAGKLESNCISISTIETAKGHEFEYVFIVGVQEGIIPAKKVDEFGISRDASRLYVAMTRACKELYLVYSSHSGSAPSRFLLNIQEFCSEFEFKAGRLLTIN